MGFDYFENFYCFCSLDLKFFIVLFFMLIEQVYISSNEDSLFYKKQLFSLRNTM
ncbi:hypothetical protein B488_12910 [Liberibacter crescens BT-1]|uniref:Uncharacterized protein n=1 Tax=Liberibacter crescens (strain BT-1) TaxID=1215343 RepID=L0EX96_LIBCB|nr:hypothetical protein B488_12910 [Liberibacter crescens BT-1]